MSTAEHTKARILDYAKAYVTSGQSVIPLWGDARPNDAKVAAVAWAVYQRRRANETEIDRWFARTPYAGVGIVTGSISQLVVFDFDDPKLLQAFERSLPELAATRTILTRRGRHLYFRLPPHLCVASRKLAGVDLLSDGHYVVAPPTVIDGHEYRLERGGLPKTLTQSDIQQIYAFLDRYTQKRAVESATRSTTPSGLSVATAEVKTQEGALSRQDESLLTAEALIALYRSLTAHSGRNVALFKTTCMARDHGWKQEAVASVLAPVHAAAMPRGKHRHENAKARRHEAIRTIRSAFSKPPRPPQTQDKEGLFNSIREKLMQLGQTCVVRVLEGLRLAGLKAGQIVTERAMLQLLKGLVGQHSIRKTLTAKTPSGEAIFERLSPRTPHSCDAASHRHQDRQNNAYVIRSKPKKSHGRPIFQYRIPTAETLCKLLGVAPSGSDPLTLDDLKAAKKTRQALQRGLIQRRPGTYLRKWLGDRLGVSETTIWRYCQQISGLNSVPTFTQTPLGWGNLNAIPAPAVVPPGTCLEDSTGKRWPAVKGIAKKLLAQGRGVRLLVRSMNYYWYGKGDPPAAHLSIERNVDIEPVAATGQPIVTFGQRIARLMWTVQPTSIPEPPKAPPREPPGQRTPYAVPPLRAGYAKPVRGRRQVYWKPLTSGTDEALAQKVYDTLNARARQDKDRVSLSNSRRWVDVYGATRIEAALRIFSVRHRIDQPAAFMLTLLRSSEAQS